MTTIEKVTAFITCAYQHEHFLLLFEHPYAGIQIPAGTVEPGETAEAAARREAVEETGLTALTVRQYLGAQEEVLSAGLRLIATPTRVYARPDAASVAWVHMRRGIAVRVERDTGEFTQITYEEFDRLPDPQYVSYGITGWVPDHALADRLQRHFYHFETSGNPMDRWTVETDNHRLTLFWATLRALPPIISPQARWIELLRRAEILPPFPMSSPSVATSTRTVDLPHKSPARQKSD